MKLVKKKKERGKPKQKKKAKKLVKKVKDPEEMFRRKPWLRPEPPYFVSRFDWEAYKPNWTYAVEELKHPVSHVVLNYHSRLPYCTLKAQCKYMIKCVQRYQCQLMRYQDLAYNWYIGGDGMVYEGRGWEKHPKQQHELSKDCLEIAFMGDWPYTLDPTQIMIDRYHDVVSYGIKKNYIKEDFQLHEFRLQILPPPTRPA